MVNVFLILSATMLAFCYTRFYGTQRHLGILFLTIVSICWISLRTQADLKFDRQWNLALCLLLIPQFIGGVSASIMHFQGPFSQSLRTVQWLKNHRLDDSVLVGHDYLVASSIPGYLGKPIYYSDTQKFGTYIQYRNSDGLPSPKPAILSAETLAETGSPTVLILNEPLVIPDSERRRIEPLAKFTGAITDEDFYIYRVY